MALPVEAAGERLYIFTDRQVYLDFAYDFTDDTGTSFTEIDNDGTDFDQQVTVFAVLLDSEGNLLRSGISGSNFSGTLIDTEKFVHSVVDAPFHAVTSTGGAYYNSVSFPSFSDVDGDGVYSSTLDVTDINALGTPPSVTDHLNISVNVTISYQGSNIKNNVTILFGTGGCYHNIANNKIGSAHGKAGTHDDVPCTACHWGYEHALGIHGPENTAMKNDPARLTGTPAWTSIQDWDYKIGFTKTSGNATTWDNSNSSFCVMCHGGRTNLGILDFGVGGAPPDTDQNDDGILDNGRPSCSWYRGPLEGSNYPACHDSDIVGNYGATRIITASLEGVDWMGESLTAGGNRSHNHSSVSEGLPCEICHAGGGTPGVGTGGLHMVAGLPNTSSTNNINEQCAICHTSEGPPNSTKFTHSSSTTDCGSCHLNAAVQLNSHLVPEAGIPNANCSECHDMGGKAPYHVDYNTMNKSDYVHYNLNSNATITGASNGEEDRMCWACHGEDDDSNSRADFDEQPDSTHSSNYNIASAHNCTYCHNNNNSSTNFGAPQNKAHTWYDDEINTTAVTGCEDCHAEAEMYNTSHVDDDHVTRIGLSVHYGTNHSYLSNSTVRHTSEYCKYCHMNTSTTFSDAFSNPENMQRSEHSSLATTPGCTVSQCHNAYALHGDNMTEPTYTDASCSNETACHDSTFNKHNDKVTCMECHMNNNQTNIHPIKYLQLDGVTFSSSSVTAAPCVTCHQGNAADAIMAQWNYTPHKVEHQHHSEDPANGSKWNRTGEDVYWDYVPDVFTFPTSWIRNEMNDSTNTNSTIANFASMTATNESATRIQETSGGAYSGDQPNNHDFPNDTHQNWSFSGVKTGVTMGWDGIEGNPAGSVYVQATGRNVAATGYWNGSFYYSNSKTIAYASIQLDSRMLTLQGAGATGDFTVYIDNGTALTEVYSRTYTVTETEWVEMEPVEIMGASQLFNVDSNYEVVIESNLVCANLKTTEVKVGYDNVHVIIKEEDFQLYNYTFNIDNVPNGVNYDYELYVGYQAHIEPASLYMYNNSTSNFEYKATLDEGSFTKVKIDNINFSYGNYNDGNVKVRINDTDIGVDTDSDYFDIQYIFVHGYKPTNYPCEYCHSPNKHSINALGIPAEFAGLNTENQSINSTTNWCASCHYEGYVSNGGDYSDVILAFQNHSLPVPPEITGNATYGNMSNSTDGSQVYVDHSGYGMSDEDCFSCHKGGLEEGTLSTEFMHNVSTGTSGNRNCTECHTPIATSYAQIDYNAVATGMHATLKNDTANPDNTTNPTNPIELICWVCHGDGLYLEPGDHYTKPAKVCEDCHITDKTDYLATNVSDHIWTGEYGSTDVLITASSTVSDCAGCHNNSINTSFVDNTPDTDTASASHYGVNKTADLLMSVGSSSIDCLYCHRNADKGIEADWGVNSSTTIDLDTKSGDHASYPLGECYNCHGGTPTDFHNASMDPGAGGGPNCIGCHDIDDSEQNVNFTAMDQSDAAHKYLNNNTGTGLNIWNEKCWACHNNGTEPASGSHGNGNYKDPYLCVDCHTSTGSQAGVYPTAWYVTEHVSNADELHTNQSFANVNDSCRSCHEDIAEMMISPSIVNDPDGASGNVYSGTHGGNESSSHYSLKRSLGTGDAYCNYCHANASSSFQYNNSNNKLIYEHTSNTSADVNNSTTLNCADANCHATGRIHNSSLTTPIVSGWSGASNSVCAPCHESSGSGSTMKVASHNTTTTGISDCAECHNDGTYGTSGAYQGIHSNNLTAGASASYDTCTECHTTDTTFVTNAVNTHYKGAVAGKGDTAAYECEDCHNLGVGASMHASGMNIPSEGCNECHNNTGSTSYDSTILIQNLNHDNATFGGAVTCDTCHDTGDEPANFHFSDYPNGTVEDTSWKSPGTLVNCIDCHTDHNETSSPYYAEPTSYHKGIYGSAIDDCYDCHTTVASATDANAAEAMHNVTITGVWDDCISCHESETNGAPEIDTTQVSAGIHQNLNSGGNGACTACHGSAADHYTTARNCDFCHMNGTDTYSSRQVTEHYPSASDLPTYFSQADNDACIDCHNKTEMMLTYTDGTPGTNPAQVAHYGATRTDMGTNDSYCNYCHNNASTVFTFENSNNKAIMEHTTDGSADVNNTSMTCQSCHVNGRIHEAALTTPTVSGWSGASNSVCAPCHESSGSGSVMKVASHNTTTTGIFDCAECHNDGTYGTSGAYQGIHSDNLTAGASASYDSCTECHTTDTTFVTNAVNTHFPGAEAGKGNTSESDWDCEECHNLNVGDSMHASGMVGTPTDGCDECHKSLSSPYSATNRTLNAYLHDNLDITGMVDVDGCEYCHNNSNQTEQFHFTQWAEGTVAVPGWGGWTNGTSANCTSCHYYNNNTAPFNAKGVSASHVANIESSTWGIDECYDCHTAAATQSDDPVAMHSVEAAPADANCTKCHDLGMEAINVDVSAMNTSQSMHKDLNADADATGVDPQYATESKRCWACHGNGTAPTTHPSLAVDGVDYRIPLKCEDCHTTNGANYTDYTPVVVVDHIPAGMNNSTNVDKDMPYCSVCHNNSVAAGINSTVIRSINDTTAHYGLNDTGSKLMTATNDSLDCMYCHMDNTNNVTWGNATYFTEHQGSTISSPNSECYGCHNESDSVSLTNLHAIELSPGVGAGPDCISCHDAPSGPKSYSLIDFSVSNASGAIHKMVNADVVSSYDSANYPCWGCHGNGSQPANGTHPTEYKTPSICQDCHVPGGSRYTWATTLATPAPSVQEHYTGANLSAASSANVTWSCLQCHQDSSGMILSNSDTDIAMKSNWTDDGYDGNGGSNSSYHYGKKRTDMGSGDDYCNYCHNNANASNSFPYDDAHNKAIIEHTANTSADVYNVTTMTCGDCHSTGRIHDSSLTTPEASDWNATGGEDKCAPCHLSSGPGSNMSVSNNMHNTSADIADCGVCHNSDAFATGGAYLSVHSDNLTAAPPAVVDTCTECHTNTTWVSMEIREHTDDGGADINAAYMTCDNSSCHGSTSAHSSDLVPSSASGWSGASNSECAPCHESSGSGSVMKVASHNTTTTGISDCAECHNDGTYGTSGAYQGIHSNNLTAGASASYDSCTECHTTDTTFVTNAVNTHYKGAVAGKGDTAAYECEDCHNLGVGASMHANGMNIPSEGCNECHNDTGSTSYDSTILIQNLNHDNATFGGAVTCDTCHDTGDEPANFHFSNYPNGTVEDTSWKSPGTLVNCIDCHTDHNETSSPYYAEPTSYHKGIYGSAIDDCYDCHTTVSTATDANAAEAMHNVTITGVWDDCISCHESETNGAPEIDTTQVSAGIHQNLNSGGNGACTACHGSAADHYTTARDCDFCHMNGTDTYSSRQVAEHYPSASELSTYTSLADNDACIDCHNKTEMMLTYTDGTPGTDPAQVAHYGATRTDMGINDTYCNYCHNNASTVFTFENANNKAIMEHTTNDSADVKNGSMECQSCHVNGRIHEAALTTPTVTEWTTSQEDYCAPCHEADDSNATMFVYDQAHNPGNAESGNITGCGFCHNATSQSPASFRIHDADMQETVPGNSTCVGCHNATTAYVGADDQILSHIPNGGQYIGNTSTSGYDNCEDCHNISVGASMHSGGLNNPVITDCTDCHINGSLSPFNSTTKVVVMSDYNHTYINETTPSCNISLCHNASGNSSFHMDAYAAADIGDPGVGWETRGDAGFSGPLVDCIDCHETHNGTEPFNAPWVEADGTGADLEDHTSKTYSIESCYVCHTNRTDASDRYMVHNVSIEPLSGGPDCLNCHNTSSNEGATTAKLLDEANLTGTAHEMLNRANGSVSQDAACWACHGTGAEPGKHPENYKDPYTCEDCHTSTGSMTGVYSNSTDVYKHYQGAAWERSKGKMTAECSVCHDNSGFVTYLSPNNMSISYNAAHYGTNDSTDVSTCITGCHIEETINVQYGAILNNKSSQYETLSGQCSYCHNAIRNINESGSWAEPNLHLQTIDVYPRCLDGTGYGAPCHQPIPVTRRRR